MFANNIHRKILLNNGTILPMTSASFVLDCVWACQSSGYCSEKAELYSYLQKKSFNIKRALAMINWIAMRHAFWKVINYLLIFASNQLETHGDLNTQSLTFLMSPVKTTLRIVQLVSRSGFLEKVVKSWSGSPTFVSWGTRLVLI